MREAQAEVKREVEAYRALREAKLRAPQPEGAALDAKVARVTAEVDRAIAGLETEYTANRETVVKLLLQVRGLAFLWGGLRGSRWRVQWWDFRLEAHAALFSLTLSSTHTTRTQHTSRTTRL